MSLFILGAEEISADTKEEVLKITYRTFEAYDKTGYIESVELQEINYFENTYYTFEGEPKKVYKDETLSEEIGEIYEGGWIWGIYDVSPPITEEKVEVIPEETEEEIITDSETQEEAQETEDKNVNYANRDALDFNRRITFVKNSSRKGRIRDNSSSNLGQIHLTIANVAIVNGQLVMSYMVISITDLTNVAKRLLLWQTEGMIAMSFFGDRGPPMVRCRGP